MKKTMLALAAASSLVTLPMAPAEARHHYTRHYQTTGNGIRYWRGNDGRYYCHRKNGTTGLIVGAAAGALVGRAVDTHGSRAGGTIIGAAVGGLLGRQVARGQVRCR